MLHAPLQDIADDDAIVRSTSLCPWDAQGLSAVPWWIAVPLLWAAQIQNKVLMTLTQ